MVASQSSLRAPQIDFFVMNNPHPPLRLLRQTQTVGQCSGNTPPSNSVPRARPRLSVSLTRAAAADGRETSEHPRQTTHPSAVDCPPFCPHCCPIIHLAVWYPRVLSLALNQSQQLLSKGGCGPLPLPVQYTFTPPCPIKSHLTSPPL